MHIYVTRVVEVPREKVQVATGVHAKVHASPIPDNAAIPIPASTLLLHP